MLETSMKVQYLHIIVRGEALCQFEMMSDDVESTNPLTVEAIILELGAYSPPVNSLSNQERVMRRGMSNQCVLKVRQYQACLINLNKYLYLFTGSKLTGKIGMTEINEILLNIMTNSWTKQAYVQGFDGGYITFKKSVKMFGRTNIAEYIDDGVVENSHKKLLGQMPTIMVTAG